MILPVFLRRTMPLSTSTMPMPLAILSWSPTAIGGNRVEDVSEVGHKNTPTTTAPDMPWTQ